MKKSKLWMFAAILTCVAGVILTACKVGKQSESKESDETAEQKKIVRSWYGENKTITDGDYDKSLAVKCINGTFVGKKADNTIVFRGIPQLVISTKRSTWRDLMRSLDYARDDRYGGCG